jgi:hypothetical protein
MVLRRWALLLVAFPFLSLLQLGIEATADPTGPPGDEAVGIFNEGTSPIEAQIEPSTGALQYTYTFHLPAARGDAQPRLSIAYSSRAGDGEAGYGWRVTLPTIERKPLSGWPIYDDTKDRFAIDGHPLVFICEVDRAECPKDESFPSLPSHSRYYRRQVEGRFDRFFYLPELRAWFVQEKGGSLLVFGDLDLVGLGSSNGADIDGFSNERPNVFRWHLTYKADTHGNIVAYRWKVLGKRNLNYLTDIFDTLNTNLFDTLNTNLFDTLNTKLITGKRPLRADDFAHHTQLSWEESGLRITSYAHADFPC